MGEFLGGRDDDGLNIRGQAAVGIRYAALILEIKHVAHAADYVMYAKFAADVDGKSIVIDYADALHAGCGLADNVYLLLGREESALILVDTNCHHDLIEHRERARENIEVPFGKRIEGPRE
jgi:hypothetical protein